MACVLAKKILEINTFIEMWHAGAVEEQ